MTTSRFASAHGARDRGGRPTSRLAYRLACSLATLLLWTWPAQPLHAQASQSFCLDAQWSDSVPRGSARALRIEQTLASAYGPAAAEGGRIDGVFDRVSLGLLDRFCNDVGGDSSNLLASIDSFAVVIEAYPAWRDTIASAAFGRWARAQPVGGLPGRIEDRKPQAPGAALLIDEYLTQRRDGLFYLTAEEIQTLTVDAQGTLYGVVPGSSGELSAQGAPPALVERVVALETLGYRYESLDSLDARLDAIFALDDVPVEPGRDPDEIDAALLIVAEALVEAESRPPAPESLNFRDFVEIGVQRPGDGGRAIDAASRNGLMQLAGKRFPNADLFRTAVRLTSGIGVARPAELARVMTLARKRPPRTRAEMRDTLGLQPIAWEGGSCGCGIFDGAPDQGGQYYYGIYPFWAAPQRDSVEAVKVPIEFSQLTRVAYYGLTFDATGQIVDSLHWRVGKFPETALPFLGRESSAFSIKAHDYKSQVDLVVYNSDWTSWLPTDTTAAGREAAAGLMATAFTRLGNELAAVISPRLPDFIDKIKPWLTFGQSPSSTIGDGVTLDFDFEGLSAADQTMLYDHLEETRFFPTLRADLDRQGGRDALFFDLTPEYSLNMILPVHCIAAFGTNRECGFYSMEHLDSIAKSVDLFLVDMNAQSADANLDLSSESLRDRARQMRMGIERMGDALGVTAARNFAYKLIPLADPAPNQLGTFFREIEPFFAGAGSWSLPVEQTYNDSLNAVFFAAPPAPTNLPFVTHWVMEHLGTATTTIELQICGVMCPLRWWVRLLILIGTLAALVLWIASEVNFSRKQIFETQAFLWFGLGMAALLMSTLWCDPFWDQHQSWILLAFVLAGLSILVNSRSRLKRQRHYP